MFFGVLPVSTILATVLCFGLAKVAYEAAMYLVTRRVIGWAKALPE